LIEGRCATNDRLILSHLGAHNSRFVNLCTVPYTYKNLQKKLKKNLHLWKFPVISNLRTNFAEMPGKSLAPGSREQGVFIRLIEEDQGRRGGESESLEEEAIEIGNS
jgi:hypothetical protein